MFKGDQRWRSRWNCAGKTNVRATEAPCIAITGACSGHCNSASRSAICARRKRIIFALTPVDANFALACVLHCMGRFTNFALSWPCTRRPMVCLSFLRHASTFARRWCGMSIQWIIIIIIIISIFVKRHKVVTSEALTSEAAFPLNRRLRSCYTPKSWIHSVLSIQ